jgi:hypothetical protein
MNKTMLLLCFVWLASSASPTTPNSVHSPAIDTKGTQANPLVIREIPAASPAVVKVLPIEKSAEQLAQEEKDRQEKRASDKETSSTNRTLVLIGLLQAFIFACQFIAFAYQSKSLNKTVIAAGEQSKDMKRYVDEASRSATAMERMATAMQANVAEVTEAFATQKVVFKSQLRAWVSVTFRACVAQTRERNYKYELQMDVTNNGNTPAVGPNTASMFRVLPVPLPAGYDLTVPMADFEDAGNLAPHRSFFIRSHLPEFLTDAEIEEVKAPGSGKCFYIYGTTRYKDIFGDPHFTNFCWSIQWDSLGNPVAVNLARHNDAT